MARNFVKADGDYLSRNGAVVAGYPFTFACWATTPSSTSGNLFSMGSTSDNWQFVRLYLSPSGNAGFSVASPYTDFTGAVPGASAGQWSHVACVGVSPADRRLYGGGSQVATSSASVTWPSMNVTALGCLHRTTRSEFLDGAMAHAAFWNVPLSAGEIAALASGTSPMAIRPGALVEYWPLEGFNRREEPGSVSGRNLAVSGTCWAPGPFADPPRAPGLHLLPREPVPAPGLHLLPRESPPPPGLHLAARASSTAPWHDSAAVAVAAGRPRGDGRPKKWYPGLGRDRGRRR